MTRNRRPAARGWGGWHKIALAERLCHGLVRIVPVVRIGRSRGGDWGIRPPTGGPRVAATKARAVALGRCGENGPGRLFNFKFPFAF
jgi:hypothetical protein